MEAVTRHWHFARSVASTITKEKTERQGTQPPIFPLDTSHLCNSYQTPQKSNMNHNPLLWDCAFQDCECLPSSQTWICIAKTFTMFPSTISLAQFQEKIYFLPGLSSNMATQSVYLPFELYSPLSALPSMHGHGFWSIIFQWHHSKLLRSIGITPDEPVWVHRTVMESRKEQAPKAIRMLHLSLTDSWGFCVSQLLVRKTNLNTGVSHHAFSK